MVEGTECFGFFVTRKTLLIATIITSVTLFPSFIVMCVGFATDCDEYYNSYFGYDVDCTARTALIVSGSVLTGFCSLILAGIIALWCRMRKAATTTTFMTTQPYTTYGTPTVSTNTLQTAAHPAPYAVPSMGHPHYQQHPQPMPHVTLPQAPMPQPPMPQAPVHQAPMHQAPMPQAPVHQESVHQAPMSQAPMLQAPVYQAPMPQATMPEAPMSQAPMSQEPMPQGPSAPMPQDPLPLKHSS